MYSEDVLNFLKQQLGFEATLVLMCILIVVPPGGLLVTSLVFLITSQSRGYTGLLLGLGVAIWASLCWLVIPYIGGYPNLPSLLILLVFSIPPDTLAAELFIHAVNFTIWPILGYVLFREGKSSVSDAIAQEQES